MWQSLAAPFAACLLLTGIHVYLGLHVLARRVVFVDLALAQLTALGAVVGERFGAPIGEGLASMAWSLGAGWLGALVLACIGQRPREEVPQEALVGVVYVVAIALTLLCATEMPHELLQGSILWVTWPQIGGAAGLYAFVGAFHFVFRRRLLQASFERDAARAAGVRLRRWDFVFYASFALVVSSSVALGGVLLVFGYLVIPAVVSMMFADSVRSRLWLGWAIGAVCSAVALVASYQLDVPFGPGIVVVMAVLLAVVGGVRRWASVAND